jgi:branched-chain amino acid transport system substrate-binding protein
MRRKYLHMALGLCFCLSGLAFGSAVDAQAAPETIKVSAVVSLTGPMSGLATQARDAYEIYVGKVNKEGGVFVKKYNKKIPIELKVYDDESTGLKTQSLLEAANSWGAVANLGGVGCSSFEMGTPIAAKNKMVWIGPGCAGWMPHQLGNKWLFSTFFKEPFLAPMVFDMIMTMPKPWPKKVALFEINQLDCQEARLYWFQKAREVDFQIVFHEKYSPGRKDFSALITGAKAADAEILLGYPTPPEGPAIVKQMKELNYSPKLIYWVRAPEASRFGPSLGELADYVTVPVAWANSLKIPGNDYLNAEYEKRHGKSADPIVGTAYAATQVLFAAIERAGTLDRAALRDAVRATHMETVAGHISFSDQGWAKDRLNLVLQWMDGKQHIVYYNKAAGKYKDMIPLKPLKWQPKWSER